MSTEVPVRRVIVRRAARIIFNEARMLFDAHTIAGDWLSDHPVDVAAQREYEKMIDTAKALNASVAQ